MHILFLCVANSARSQMAEGLARSMAPKGVRVSSAGSVPSSVRPEAISALLEIGIDIRDHRSKGTSEFSSDDVDLIVTLCAEEACPVELLGVERQHWPVTDPATDSGSLEERLDRFRVARDTLAERLRSHFQSARD